MVDEVMRERPSGMKEDLMWSSGQDPSFIRDKWAMGKYTLWALCFLYGGFINNVALVGTNEMIAW